MNNCSKPFRSRGYIMVEWLLVAGVVLVGVVAVVLLYRTTMTKGGTDNVVTHTRQLLQNVEQGWGVAQSYHGLTNQAAVDRELIPKAFLQDGQARTAWGPIELSGLAPDYRSWAVSFSNVPANACQDLVLAIAPGLESVRIDGQDIPAGRSIEVGTVASACVNGGSVALVRREPGLGMKAGWETW